MLSPACAHPTYQEIICVLAAAMLATAAMSKINVGRLGRLLGAPLALTTAALWIGSASYSQLGFAEAQVPMLSGFRITRPGRPALVVQSGEVLVLAKETPVEIEPVTWPRNMIACIWRHSRGSAIDEPGSCDIAYQPAAHANFDALQLVVRSTCGMPATSGELRVSLLP